MLVYQRVPFDPFLPCHQHVHFAWLRAQWPKAPAFTTATVKSSSVKWRTSGTQSAPKSDLKGTSTRKQLVFHGFSCFFMVAHGFSWFFPANIGVSCQFSQQNPAKPVQWMLRAALKLSAKDVLRPLPLPGSGAPILGVRYQIIIRSAKKKLHTQADLSEFAQTT